MTMTKFLITSVSCLALVACTSAQIAATSATASKYQADVQAACNIAVAALNNPLATAAKDFVPAVAQAANLVTSSCTTEEQIATLVNSPTSVAWLGTLSTTIKTGGKTVPPAPVAP